MRPHQDLCCRMIPMLPDKGVYLDFPIIKERERENVPDRRGHGMILDERVYFDLPIIKERPRNRRCLTGGEFPRSPALH